MRHSASVHSFFDNHEIYLGLLHGMRLFKIFFMVVAKYLLDVSNPITFNIFFRRVVIITFNVGLKDINIYLTY